MRPNSVINSGPVFSAIPSHPEPLHHVLLNLAVSRDVQDESTGQVSLVITHEHVLVLDVFQHQQLQEESNKRR